MATLNLSLPTQLKTWVNQQVDSGHYSSASDYLRDLIREDIRSQKEGLHWLADKLKPLTETPDEEFMQYSADDVKQIARERAKDQN